MPNTSTRRDTRPRGFTARLSHRLRSSRVGRRWLALQREIDRRTVVWHWSRLFGVAAVACVIVLFATGIPLMMFYVPVSQAVLYDGPWTPMRGQEVSRAYDSVMALSLEARGGLLLRQTHHWAALLLPAVLIVQMLATYVTGRHRRPGRLAWLLLCGVVLSALLGGWSGYALPDDMLSGSGLRIFHGILLSIPVIGTPLATWLFGGEFPGRILETLYPVHVGVAPLLLLVLIALRAVLAWHVPGPRRSAAAETSWTRSIPLRAAAPRAMGLVAMTAGVVVLAGSFVTVAPVWVAGPSDPGNATAGSQPDWYTGFLDGALRLVPPGWEVELAGRTVVLAMLVPLAVVGAFIAAVILLPMLEGGIRRDARIHLRVERPRDAPARTAIAVASLTFFAVLWGAASSDVIALEFQLAVEQVILAFQVGLILAPLTAFALTHRLCLDLRAKDRELLAHGVETGRIVRLPGGEYVEVHEDLDPERRAMLTAALEPVDRAPRRRVDRPSSGTERVAKDVGESAPVRGAREPTDEAGISERISR